MPCPPVYPEFIHSIEHHWPFLEHLPGCHLVSSSFDPDATSKHDFQYYGLQPAGSSRKRQSEFLAGRICAAEALALSGHRFQLPARDTASGRPVWPAGHCGSITHSHGVAAAVTGPTDCWKGLGLDVERLILAPRAKRLSGAILVPDERHWLEGQDEQTVASRLTLIFSAKESLFKALNPLTGVYFGFQDAEAFCLEAQNRLGLRLLRNLSDEYRAGMEFSCQWVRHGHGVLTLVHVATC